MSVQAASGWPSPWRMLLLFVAFGAAAVYWGDVLATALFPLWQAEMGWLNAHWAAERLWIDQEGADRVIRVSLALRGCARLGGGVVCAPAEPLGNASTLLGNATLPSALLAAAVLGWPRAGGSWWARVPGLGLALLLLWMLDVPLALGAAFAQVWRDAIEPGSGTVLLAWGEFLQSGGRMALAVVLAAGVLLASGGRSRQAATSKTDNVLP